MSSVSDIREVEDLRDKTIYSNAPDYLRMISDLDVRDYPLKYASTTLNGNASYDAEIKQMRNAVLSGDSVLVHYEALEWRRYYPDFNELTFLGFQPVLNGRGVAVLVATDPVP